MGLEILTRGRSPTSFMSLSVQPRKSCPSAGASSSPAPAAASTVTATRPPKRPAGPSIDAYRGLGSWVDIFDARAWANQVTISSRILAVGSGWDCMNRPPDESERMTSGHLSLFLSPAASERAGRLIVIVGWLFLVIQVRIYDLLSLVSRRSVIDPGRPALCYVGRWSSPLTAPARAV